MSIFHDNLIQEQARQVRELINNPRRHYELRQDEALFLQLCSALDVIEDTEEAIAAYCAKDAGETKGSHYLAVYGLLQSLYVQQDAIIHLCESLGIQVKVDAYPKLKEIRDIRNDSVGHPTKRGRKKGQPATYHHISRITLGQTGFTLASFCSTAVKAQFKGIDIPDLIGEQRKYVSEILTALTMNLETKDREHRERFRMEKLASLFPDALGYYSEKVFEGISRAEYVELAAGTLELINEAAYNFREAVGRRNLDSYESLQDDYSHIEHVVAYLKNYYDAKAKEIVSEGDTKTARIFAKYLRNEMDRLKTYASEIDEEYEAK